MVRTLLIAAAFVAAQSASAQTPYTHWQMHANQAYYAQNYYYPGSAPYYAPYYTPVYRYYGAPVATRRWLRETTDELRMLRYDLDLYESRSELRALRTIR